MSRGLAHQPCRPLSPQPHAPRAQKLLAAALCHHSPQHMCAQRHVMVKHKDTFASRRTCWHHDVHMQHILTHSIALVHRDGHAGTTPASVNTRAASDWAELQGRYVLVVSVDDQDMYHDMHDHTLPRAQAAPAPAAPPPTPPTPAAPALRVLFCAGSWAVSCFHSIRAALLPRLLSLACACTCLPVLACISSPCLPLLSSAPLPAIACARPSRACLACTLACCCAHHTPHVHTVEVIELRVEGLECVLCPWR